MTGRPPTWIAIVVPKMSFWAANKDYFVNGGVSALVLVGTWLVYRGIKHAVDRFSRRRNLAEVRSWRGDPAPHDRAADGRGALLRAPWEWSSGS